MIDIVMPSGNEEEFISVAHKLGYRGLYFLYALNDYLKHDALKSDLKTYCGILAEPKKIDKLKTQNKDFIAVKSSSYDREIIEGSKANLIFSFEDGCKKDFMHHRASGLNHILCRIARKNQITIGFSLREILGSDNPGLIMGRMMQNIALCAKFKVNTAIASFAENPMEMRSPHDLTSFFKLLGHNEPVFLKAIPE